MNFYYKWLKKSSSFCTSLQHGYMHSWVRRQALCARPLVPYQCRITSLKLTTQVRPSDLGRRATTLAKPIWCRDCDIITMHTAVNVKGIQDFVNSQQQFYAYSRTIPMKWELKMRLIAQKWHKDRVQGSRAKPEAAISGSRLVFVQTCCSPMWTIYLCWKTSSCMIWII